MTPLAAALNRDQTRLFIVCADVNVVAVADITEERARLAGLLPVGAYPTSARVLADGRLVVLNGAGNSVSVIPPLEPALLATLTDAALALVSYTGTPALAAIPAPVENVVYVSPDADSGPNLEKLAAEFAAVPNYLSNSDGPAANPYWQLAGLAPPFTRLLAHVLPAARFAGNDPANLPPAGFLWTNAASARLPARNYGVLAPALETSFPSDFAQLVKTGIPRLTITRAVSDAELGQIVERVSKSAVWPKTAVFVGGARPVVISPYSRAAKLPTTGFYNDSSILRTMEMILTLRPMTVFDAAARPLLEAFAEPADTTPFEALP
jgi:hypothetical protein